MIFFVANDGTVISSVPSPVYQGGANTNNIFLVAPFAENLQASVAFKLPNGIYTTRYPMVQANNLTGIVEEKSGKTYNGWQFSMPNDITQYYGTVTAQFFFYSAQGGIITTTSAVTFVVERGVPAILPDTPSEDVYEIILSNLAALSQQLNNGAFSARAIYAWNSAYTYGMNELTFYADYGKYGAFIKSLKANNNDEPFIDGKFNSDSWLLISDFNILNELYSLQTQVEEALAQSRANAEAAGESASAAESSQEGAAASAVAAQEAAESVKDSADYLESVKNGTVAVVKAVSDGNGENIAEHFEDIEQLIPSTTTPENQLADKAFVNSSINAMAAFYITANAAGDAFTTKASLTNATTFYQGGQARVPTQNDYAIVLADESQPKGVDGKYPTTRYSYQGGTYPNGQWDFQYIVNNTSLTQAQVNAVNSGITAALVEQINTNKEDIENLESSNVTGVKGNAETAYRAGNVNLTPANIGAAPATALTDGSVTKIGTTTKGSSTKPIYLNAGTPTECSRSIPLITLNGSQNTSPSIYAPTSVGNSGYYLKSTGSGAPTWENKLSTLRNISTTVAGANTGTFSFTISTADWNSSTTVLIIEGYLLYDNGSRGYRTITVPVSRFKQYNTDRLRFGIDVYADYRIEAYVSNTAVSGSNTIVTVTIPNSSRVYFSNIYVQR